MVTGILHLHITIVTLFLLLLVVKTFFLLFNKREALTKLRAMTKIADMILGVLILLTGGYLLSVVGFATYLVVKIVITLLAIPLAIIAFKKENKALALLTLVAFIAVYGIAESKPWESATKIEVKGTEEMAMPEKAQAIYTQNCTSCHGVDGKLGAAGAKDLSQTNLSKEEMVKVIANGQGLMPAFGERLSREEIAGLADYVKTLGNN